MPKGIVTQANSQLYLESNPAYYQLFYLLFIIYKIVYIIFWWVFFFVKQNYFIGYEGISKSLNAQLSIFGIRIRKNIISQTTNQNQVLLGWFPTEESQRIIILTGITSERLGISRHNFSMSTISNSLNCSGVCAHTTQDSTVEEKVCSKRFGQAKETVVECQ